MTVQGIEAEHCQAGSAEFLRLPAGRFDLEFYRHGDTTRIGRQFVSYPYHLTRPFALDKEIPSLATVYQQSASGGIYRGDQLSSHIVLGSSAAVHLTTQAGTIVHDCMNHSARQSAEINLGSRAYLAFAPEACVVFPGAAFEASVRMTIEDDAVAFLCDAFAPFDPKGLGRTFQSLVSDIAVFGNDGRMLLRDRSTVRGIDLGGDESPIGRWRICASYFFLGAADRLPSRHQIEETVAECGAAICGVSSLPNGAGTVVRSLAADAVAARQISEGLFSLSVLAAFGCRPAPRRK